MFEQELGWHERDFHACPAYGHDGQWVIEGNIGVRSGIMILPDDVEAVLLINTNGPFFPHRILESGFEDCYPRISHSVDSPANRFCFNSARFGDSPAPCSNDLPRTKTTSPASMPTPASPNPYFQPKVSPR